MAILVDTQAIVWLASEPDRLSRHALDAMTSGADDVFVSAVTAFEFNDLNRRGRFKTDLPLQIILAQLSAVVLDYPADAWRLADALPDLHRDPVDRMLVAHAIHADLTLVTADKTMRSYPVRSLW